MTKVIKGEFEKLESVKISDVSLTCNTSLEIFNEEFNRMSRMEDYLFTYEVEIAEARGDDEVELTDEESSYSDDENEVAKIFRINANVFDFETPLCRAFKEFNYLLQIDPDVLTKDIDVFKTYEEYKDDWRYEWNKDVPWDGKLQKEALKNKAIMDGMIDEDDESSNKGWKRWDDFDNTNRDNEESENETEHEEEERSEVFDDHERPVCNIRRFDMVKYSFKDNEKYVAIKENEYDDLTNTSKEAIHAYQEIFRMMDEGWMDLAAKKSTKLVKYRSSGILCVIVVMLAFRRIYI
ncbi:hypothetical protein Tco_0031118 [Tanacetum coccineum]